MPWDKIPPVLMSAAVYEKTQRRPLCCWSPLRFFVISLGLCGMCGLWGEMMGQANESKPAGFFPVGPDSFGI